jgi:hypothetical protein
MYIVLDQDGGAARGDPLLKLAMSLINTTVPFTKIYSELLLETNGGIISLMSNNSILRVN